MGCRFVRREEKRNGLTMNKRRKRKHKKKVRDTEIQSSPYIGLIAPIPKKALNLDEPLWAIV